MSHLIKSGIDYTHIYCNQQDIKNIFRRVKRQETRFKETLAQSHNKFYQKIMHYRRLQLREDFDSTIETTAADSQLVTNSNAQYLKQKKKRFSTSSINDLDTGLTLEQKMKIRNKSQSNKTKSQIQKPQASNKTANDFASIERVDKELEAMFEQQRIKYEEQKLIEKQHKQMQPEIELLFTDDHSKELVTFVQYMKFMKDSKVLDLVVEKLAEMKHLTTGQVNDLRDLLPHADKKLFYEYRDAQITLDQLKARVYEKAGKGKYVCLDDLIQDGLHPPLYQDLDKVEDIMKLVHNKQAIGEISPLDMVHNYQEWQSDPHCLKSIYGLATKKPKDFLKAKDKPKKEESETMTVSKLQKSKSTVVSPSKRSTYRAMLPRKDNIQKDKKSLYIQKLKNTLNSYSTKYYEEKLLDQGMRSKEIKPDLSLFCAPFDLKRLEEITSDFKGQSAQESKLPITSKDLSNSYSFDKRTQGSNSKKIESKDLRFLKHLKQDGESILVSPQDQHLLIDYQNDNLTANQHAKKNKVRKPRPRDIMSKQKQVQTVPHSQAHSPVSRTKVEDPCIIDPHQYQQNFSNQDQMMSYLKQLSHNDSRPLSGVSSLRLNYVTQQHTPLQQIQSNLDTKQQQAKDSSLVVLRNIKSQQQSRRPSITQGKNLNVSTNHIPKKKYSEQFNSRTSTNRNASTKVGTTCEVSENFINFVGNLGIPINESFMTSHKKKRIVSAQRQHSQDNNISNMLNSPSVDGLSYKTHQSKIDYKSNAIAYRLTKKQEPPQQQTLQPQMFSINI